MAKLLRRQMPLTSFDPRFHDLIVRGTRETVTLTQPSRREAKRLMHLLTTYRARYRDHWREKGDDKWEVLYSAIIGLSEDGMSTVIRPRSLEVKDLLSNVTYGGEQAPSLTGDSEETLIRDPLLDLDPNS